MDSLTTIGPTTLLQEVTALVPGFQVSARALDQNSSFPAVEVEQLRRIGCLVAPLPTRFGGLGLGTEAKGASSLAILLRLLGRGNLSLARIFEAHVNALRLIFLYATPSQQERAAADVRAGHLLGLWVTDGSKRLSVEGSLAHGELRGGKTYCSAAGFVARAVVTAEFDHETYLLYIPVDPSVRAVDAALLTHGMRASATGPVNLDGIRIMQSSVIGPAGIYLREPEFSAGAWRTCAAQVGGMDALVTEARLQLVGRHRDDQPHQLARMGKAVIAQETAALWVARASRIADDPMAPQEDRHAYVNLARTAVERACLDALELVHRSLGLPAFVPPNPVERLSRDLATYLRQPAPDEALSDAASWYMRHELPFSGFP